MDFNRRFDSNSNQKRATSAGDDVIRHADEVKLTFGMTGPDSGISYLRFEVSGEIGFLEAVREEGQEEAATEAVSFARQLIEAINRPKPVDPGPWLEAAGEG